MHMNLYGADLVKRILAFLQAKRISGISMNLKGTSCTSHFVFLLGQV